MKKINILSCFLFVLLIGLWELVAHSLSELIVPAPSVVFPLLWKELLSGYYLPHIVQTTAEVLIGLTIGAVIGIGCGVLMGEFRLLERLLSPYVIASQAVPKIALAPLFILWFGFGMTSKVVITALICFFPLLENTMTAMKQVDHEKVRLFQSLEASRFKTFIHLKLPHSLPMIFSGLRVAVVLALVGAVVGEFIGANKGLGALIIASQGMLDTPLMFTVLILLTLLGMILYSLVHLLEIIIKKIIFKRPLRNFQNK